MRARQRRIQEEAVNGANSSPAPGPASGVGRGSSSWMLDEWNVSVNLSTLTRPGVTAIAPTAMSAGCGMHAVNGCINVESQGYNNSQAVTLVPR